MTLNQFKICSIIFFEVYKGKYLGDVLGYADKGPLIDKCILKTNCLGFGQYAENSSDDWVLYFNGLVGSINIRKNRWDGIKTVEEFFKITKIDFEDII